MKYLILSDTHLGCIQEDNLAKLQLLMMVNKDANIIWCGDIIDRLVYEQSYVTYSNFVRPQDIAILGNHDYDPRIKLSTQLQITDNNSNTKIFITHGDLVDFGLGFKLVQDLSFSLVIKLLKHKLISLAALACLLRMLNPRKKWSIYDTYTFYQILIDLSDEDISAFHSNKVKAITIKNYIKALARMLKCSEKRAIEDAALDRIPNLKDNYVKVLDSKNAFFGLFTANPEMLLERVLLLYPECVDSDVIVIGHIHHSCNKVIKASNGKEYQFIILGAWVGGVVPSYISIDTSKYPSPLEVVQVE